ncbi:MAG TPA: tripartite tricarboxylate transporter substrate binding protein [Anaerolineae bacterium]
MRKFTLHRLLLTSVLALGLAAQAQAQAQDYPDKPVRIIVPSPPGSTTDAFARLIGQKLSAKWGQPVLVENRAGAGGNLGAEAVFRSPPDGSMLLFTAGPLVQKSLYPKLNYDPEGLVPLSAAAVAYLVLVVNSKVPAQTLPELIAYAKANPDKLNYASQGIASNAHLTGEMFKGMAGVKIVHVPYKGLAPALTDLVAGQVDMAFFSLGQSLPHIRSGKLRALAISSEKRSPLLPDLPTVSETVPGFISTNWFGMFAPPGTPPAIANKISAATHEALHTPEIASWLSSTNAYVAVGGTPAETAQFIRQDNERWIKVIKATGITAE